MGFFTWLFGGAGDEHPHDTGRSFAIVGDGTYDFEVVGEASYQAALDHICGGRTDEGHEMECTAVLTEEPTNRFDPNAVMVTVDNRKVGYLSRREAVAYRKALAASGLAGLPVHVEAVIVGGWDRGSRGEGHYGVKLDMEIPPRFAR